MAIYSVYYHKIGKSSKGYRAVLIEAGSEAQARKKWEQEFPYLTIYKIELEADAKPNEAGIRGEEKREVNTGRTKKLWMGFGCLLACLGVVVYERMMIGEGYELTGFGYAPPIILGVAALVLFVWAKKKEPEVATNSPEKLEAKQEKWRAKMDRMKGILGGKTKEE